MLPEGPRAKLRAMATLTHWPSGGEDRELERLQDRYLPSLDAVDIPGLLADPALARIAIVSSFGAESAALLHYVTTHGRPRIPVLFLDTHKHFPETLDYARTLAEALSLDLRMLTPDAAAVAAEDPSGDLHAVDPNACCTLRKTFPLQDAVAGFDGWISGRKRFQSTTRATVPVLERDGEKIKINPLALWTREDIAAYFDAHALPRHPLEARGYLSIGCAPCTRAVRPGDDPRAGRWAHLPDKTECGIHLGPDGRFVRSRKGEA